MYAIAGANGRTGGAVAEALLARGEQIRVIVRDAATAERWRGRGAEVAVADLRDPRALADALRGSEGAYLLTPVDLASPDASAHQRALVTGIRGALEAARLPHLVFLSSIGAELASGTGPVVGLYLAEQVLQGARGTACTFVRSGYFMENLGGSLGMLGEGLLPTFFPEDHALPMVSARDTGAAAARMLLEGPRGARVVCSLGPRPYSYRDAGRILSDLLGREIRVHRLPLEAMVPTLQRAGMSEGVARASRELTEALTDGRIQIRPDQETLRGSTGLEAVLRALVAPVLPASPPPTE